MITKKDLFFCYNSNVVKFLKEKGLPSLTTAIEPNSGQKFTLFPKSNELQIALDEYKQLQNK